VNERPSLIRLIEIWKAKSGVPMRGERGTEYIGIPFGDRLSLFMDLFQTMVNLGYSKAEISSPTVQKKLIDECWPEMITKMTAKNLKISKDIVRKQWNSVLDKFSDLEISKYKEPERQLSNTTLKETIDQQTKEEILDDLYNPKDRLVMNTSDWVKPPIVEDLFAEIAALEESLKEDKNE
jgi:hypothetical protein